MNTYAFGRWPLVVASLLVAAPSLCIAPKVGHLHADFHAFYCAARMAVHHANPYLAGPLQVCERISPPIPAPAPGYLLALLTPFAALAYPQSLALWSAVLLIAAVATALVLARQTNVDVALVASAFSLSLGLTSFVTGEIVPIAILALCLSGFALRNGRDRLAALAFLPATIEPHVALPCLLGIVIWRREARLPFAAAVCAVLALWVTFSGVDQILYYINTVLPAHVRSEALAPFQLSLTSALVQFGMPVETAVRTGEISYLCSLIVGVVVAGKLQQKYRDAAFLALVPPAFALFGGVYIHAVQMPFALPAAFLLISHEPRLRVALTAAISLLAVPFGFFFARAVRHIDNIAVHPRDLAEVAWNQLIQGSGITTGLDWICRITIWIALVALIASAVSAAAREVSPAVEPA